MNRFVKVSVLLASLLGAQTFADESFGGIGITIVPAKSGVRVVEVIPGSPAEEAGILPSDRIFKVDAVSIGGLRPQQHWPYLPIHSRCSRLCTYRR